MIDEHRERPLKGLREMIQKNSVMFGENPSKKQLSQKKLKKFIEMRKWDSELERIDREETRIKKSLNEINLQIEKTIKARALSKSNVQIKSKSTVAERKKFEFNMSKINNVVSQAKKNKQLGLFHK